MPLLDRTGPDGQGAKTGRGLGNCPGADNTRRIKDIEFATRAIKTGSGIGGGRGRRFRNPNCILAALINSNIKLS